MVMTPKRRLLNEFWLVYALKIVIGPILESEWWNIIELGFRKISRFIRGSQINHATDKWRAINVHYPVSRSQ